MLFFLCVKLITCVCTDIAELKFRNHLKKFKNISPFVDWFLQTITSHLSNFIENRLTRKSGTRYKLLFKQGYERLHTIIAICRADLRCANPFFYIYLRSINPLDTQRIVFIPLLTCAQKPGDNYLRRSAQIHVYFQLLTFILKNHRYKKGSRPGIRNN
jgi:hypothetical protein